MKILQISTGSSNQFRSYESRIFPNFFHRNLSFLLICSKWFLVQKCAGKIVNCQDFWDWVWVLGKGGFFSERAIRFSNLQNKIFPKTILSLKFKFPANYSILLLAGNLNFKFRIVFWNIFFGDLKNKSHFLKKSHL